MTGSENDRAWPQMTAWDPKSFHAPRVNRIILSQLGNLWPHLNSLFVKNMTSIWPSVWLLMTSYDLSHMISSNDLKPNKIMGNRKLRRRRKMLLWKFVRTTGMRTASRSRTVICTVQEKCRIFNSMENSSRISMGWFQWIWTRITSTGLCLTLFTARELESKLTF